MAAFIKGYGYDILNSYRLNDNNNKGDHWVTVFANALSSALEATFKEVFNYGIK